MFSMKLFTLIALVALMFVSNNAEMLEPESFALESEGLWFEMPELETHGLRGLITMAAIFASTPSILRLLCLLAFVPVAVQGLQCYIHR